MNEACESRFTRNQKGIPRIMTPPPPCHLGLVPHIVFILGPVHEDQDHKRDEEEYAIHDAEREARFLHRAFVFDVGGDARRSRDSVGAHAQICRAAVTEAGAAGSGDAAELIDAGYEGADEAEVDEGDEEGGSLGGLATEESEDRPYSRKGGDDEEGPVRRIC